MGSRNGTSSGSRGIGGGSMSRCAPPISRGHTGHQDNTRCDWLAQNAAATQRSSWADGRPYAPLLLDLGVDYVPPKPQLGLFEDVEPSGEDDEDADELNQKTWLMPPAGN